MIIQNIFTNNPYKSQYQQSQRNSISFEARKLKLSKEIVFDEKQFEQLSFIAKAYRKAMEFSSKLNGVYRYKFKDCFPGMVAGEVKKGFVFEGLLPSKNKKLQVAKLDAHNEKELFSLRVVDKDYNDLLTCRVNKDGTALLTSDTFSAPTLRVNPFEQKTKFNSDKFLTMLSEEFSDLELYSDNFISISRTLKGNMNPKTVRSTVAHLRELQKSSGLKPEMDFLIANYTELDSLLKIGRSTNAVTYKRMYFGDDYDCAKGILFRNVGQNGETYLYCPAKSKDDNRVLRLVVQDKDGKIKNGFVFFEDGRVMKQVNVEGMKAEDFRIQNLALLSDNEIESLNLRATMDVVNQNITNFKSFVAGKVQAKSDKKARRKAELIQKAERKEQRLERRIEKEKISAQKEKARKEKEEARKVKEQAAEKLRQEKEEARIAKEQQAARLKQQREEFSLLREAEKIVLEEEKEILEQRKLQAQLMNIARRAKSVQEKMLGALNPKVNSKVRAAERRIEDRYATKELVPKKEEVFKPRKRLTAKKDQSKTTYTNLELRPVTRQVVTSRLTFNQFSIPKFVNNLTDLFETPVDERSPHLIHEYLPDGRIFKGRITIKTFDGAQVTVSKIKSPLYVDFSYYSVKVVKDGQTYILNFDKEVGKLLESTPKGRLVIDEKHRVHYVAKSVFAKECPIADKIPTYLEEFFVKRDDAEKVVLSTGLKVSNFSSQDKILAQREQEILEALKLEPDYND